MKSMQRKSQTDLHPASQTETKSMTSLNLKTKRARGGVDATELSANLQVLRSMSEQIVEVQKDMQQSVEDVCVGFNGMAEKAKHTVDIASNVLGDKETEARDGDLIGNVRITLNAMLDSIRESSQSSAEIAGEIELMNGNLGSINACLKEIEDIARGAKLVALNGSIEAARAGEVGVVFNVAAQETRHLAANAGAASVRIRDTVGGLTESLIAASEQLTERANQNAAQTSKSESAATSSLNMLSQMHELITTAMQETERVSQSLSQDISRSIVAMQFQDRVNQRLDHVVQTIQQICDRIEPNAKLVSAPRKQQVVDQWLAQLSEQYTMAAEREVHSAQKSGAAATEDTGDFELF